MIYHHPRSTHNSALKAEKTAAPFSLEEREAAYKAARERIFTRYEGEMSEPMKQKPRSIPVVARRMIAHALGGRVNSSNQEVGRKDTKEHGEKTDGTYVQEKEQGNTNLSMETHEETNVMSGQNINPHRKPKVTNLGGSASSHIEKEVPPRPADKTSTKPGIFQPQRSEISGNKDNLKEEHMVAAKRMFAHALGTSLCKRHYSS
ncbi:uncharacterized protein LOC130760220 [Actinidia eriantha]|uniref:uncharacterized protein LOC130760220 n=1 Tax=Actinidia eriantha TaxID=165200 RepID=UPI00258DF5DE|nr:uncharacterized protein LOC130760220 [Actinidia eriantha]